jgi:antitoxin CptB
MIPLNKLRWRCRRGTKELDLLLLNYLDKHYLTATVAEQQSFLQLLTQEDDKLLRYFLGDIQPDDETLTKVVRTLTAD